MPRQSDFLLILLGLGQRLESLHRFVDDDAEPQGFPVPNCDTQGIARVGVDADERPHLIFFGWLTHARHSTRLDGLGNPSQFIIGK